MLCTGNEFKVENYKDYRFRTMIKHKEKIINQLRQIKECSLKPGGQKEAAGIYSGRSQQPITKPLNTIVSMETNKKVINGREFEYGDVVIHTTYTRFSFWDRIKILFGKQVTIQSEIYCQEPEVSVMGSEARTSVEPFIKRKQKGGMIECVSSASPAPAK